MEDRAKYSRVGYTRDQIDKIGNTIIYLAQYINDLTKTKVLKILFLLEEASIKTTGQPFIGINFQLWKLGPVAKDVFIDLSSDESPALLHSYLERDPADNKIFRAKVPFNNDEFSVNDLRLMDTIIEFVKDKPAAYLIKHTHGPNSLWRRSAIQYGVLEALEKELVNSTEYEVDFSLLFPNPSYLSERYAESRENLQFIRTLKD
ncbi:Panacea domain-containing protein [Puia sp.]|jgi:uncharacterized phage-associated protein|uniref:Panacea domain-containing protein n=1 Tax=Puia sp. TaxID=2045100 RepID=UPI002F424DF5